MKKQLPTTNAQTSSAFFSVQPLLRNLFVLFLIIGFAGSVKADFAVTTNSGSGLSATYPSLAAAITALNLATITSPVVITCPTGTETSPSGGYVITAQGTAVNTIIIQGNGAANSIITAPAPAGIAGSLIDAIFKLIGADFITIQGFAMNENPANDGSPAAEFTAATNTMVEWGVALLHASVTNGAQNNIIQNNSITLNRAYTNSFGIYSNNSHSATVVGTNESVTNNTTAPANGNKFYSNLISNVNMGIALIGGSSGANVDVGNDVGGSSAATGNTITNWGGAAAASTFNLNGAGSYCILLNVQIGENASFNTITSATISGTSVALRGIFKFFSAASTVVGITNITNNTITITDNFTSGTLECIRTQDVIPAGCICNLNNNIILNTSVGGAASSTTIVGIINTSAWATLNINNNVIRGTTSTATTGGFTGISNSGSVTSAININNNQIGNSLGGAITYSVANSGAFTGITNSAGTTTCALSIQTNDFRGITYSAASTASNTYITNSATSPATFAISFNTFTNLNVNTSGSITFLGHSGNFTATSVTNINNNSIVTAFNKGGAGGSITIRTSASGTPAGAVVNFQNNNFSNITFTGATSFDGYRDNDGGAPTKGITGNIFNNISGGTGGIACLFAGFNGNNTSISNNMITNITSQGGITAINLSSSGTAALQTCANNTISNLVSNGTGGSVTGIVCSSAATTTNVNNNSISTLSSTAGSAVNGISITGGVTINVFKNTICDVLGLNANSSVTGITVVGGTTINISNNRIGDLRATAANNSNPLNGINIAAGTTINAYYNTVNLSAMSSGALFGSSAISVSTVPTVTLNSNIFVNNSSVMGAGLAVAYRRANTTLGTYGAASDRNDFFASTIFTDGTGPNTFSALGPYKTFVGPTRDANSVTENPPFLSTTCGNTNFLKINTAIATLVESNGANVGGITNDFENDIRFGNPGYAGTGTKPDLGADEFNGIPSAQCMGAPSAGSITGVAAVCTGLGTTLNLSGASTDLGITYQWKSSTTMGGPYLTLLGTSTTQATGPLTMPTYYVVDVTCTNPGGLTVTTAEKSVLINPLPTVMVSPTTGAICNPSGSPVSLTASGASTYTWSPTTGLTPTTGPTVSANPPSTTTYIATGTDINGCMNTGSATITVAEKPQLNVTASPPNVCTGGNSNLLAAAGITSAYTVSAATYASQPTTGFSAGPSGDDVISSSIPLPFPFTFFGVTYNSIFINTNGQVGFDYTGSSAAQQRTPQTVPSSTLPNANISLCWADLNAAAGQITFGVVGSSPNRIFVIDFNAVPFFTPPGVVTGQIQLFELDKKIQVHVTAVTLNTASKTLGIENAAGTVGNAPAGRNNANWLVSTPEAWTFQPSGGTFMYQWSPGTFLSSTTVANPTAIGVTVTTTYTVTVTELSGCTSTGSVTVNTTPLSCNTPSVSSPLCSGTNFTVTANPVGGGSPYSYLWNTGATTSFITDNKMAGMYTYNVTVTDACMNSCTSSVVVTVNALPSVMVSPTTGLICNPGGSPVNLTASGASTYSWSPTTNLTPTSGSPVSANPPSTTIYTVTGTDANGCMNTASATVNVGAAVNLSSVTVSPDPVCLGQSATLTANASFASTPFCASTHSNGSCDFSEGDKILLVNLNTLNNPSGCVAAPGYTDFTAGPTTTLNTGSNPFTLSVSLGPDANQFVAAWIDYNQDGTFNTTTEFLGTSGNVGANGIAMISFSVPGTALNGPTRLRVIGGNDSAILSTQSCGASSSNFGETEDYTVTIAGAINPFSYLWSPAMAVSSTTTNPTTALPITMNTSYFVTVTSNIGCAATGSVLHTFTPPPALSGPPTICSGQNAQYSPMSGGTWMTSDPMIATITNTGLASAVTTGMVTFTFTSTATGCSNTINATVIPSPSATITSNTSIYQGSTGNVASVPSAGAGATYLWSLSSGMITSGAGTNSILYKAGTPPSMNINVTVTSSNGCSSSGSKVVTILIPGPATMTWERDNVTPTSCGPSTNCCLDTICYNLKYTPGVTGFVTTYTTGFFINCLGATSPIGYNKSCVMTDNSFQISQCALIDSVLFNSSGNNGGVTVPITQGAPIILHRVCLNISTGESVQIREDNITNLSASVDQAGSGHLTEFQTYATQTFSKPAPVIPANITVTISCPADTLFPVPPPVVDFCGNTVPTTLTSRVSTPSSLSCEGTKVYNFNYIDCSGYTQPWSFTYIVEYQDFTIATPPGGSIVACPALSSIVPTPPVVIDNCGRTLSPTIADSGVPACEGLRFYVFTYTDCEGNTHNWVYTYFVEYEPIPNPVDITQTVDCPLLANVVPVPPTVVDNCGVTLSPSGPTSTPALTAMTCEGMRSFTWTYIDCEGNTQDFVYTYIVERQPFADPVDGGIIVGCPVETNAIPAPAMVFDNCGTLLSPSGPVVSPIPACEGTRTYTYTYTDCEGNTGDYVFTYTVDRPPFTVPADGGSIVNCPEASNVVPLAPVVTDACGVALTPFDTIKTAAVTCQGVDVTRTYTFHYKDCSGLTIPWVYTYTVRCFPLTLKVFLEGPYDVMGDTMKSTLNTNHVLPGQDKLLSPSLSVQLLAPYTPFGQPYNVAPWNYNGNTGLQYGDPSSPGAPMGVIPYPADVVDWVLVTVRKGGILPANNFWSCAGWVHTNGVVTFPDPCPGLVFNPGDSCYVLVQHRTHLGALSTHAAMSTCTNYIINWDFTTTNSYAPIFRYGQKLVEPGKWALHGANGDQITSIAAIGSADLTTWRIFQNAYGYSIGDYNMSAFTESAGDESLWKANQNRTSGIIFY